MPVIGIRVTTMLKAVTQMIVTQMLNANRLNDSDSDMVNLDAGSDPGWWGGCFRLGCYRPRCGLFKCYRLRCRSDAGCGNQCQGQSEICRLVGGCSGRISMQMMVILAGSNAYDEADSDWPGLIYTWIRISRTFQIEVRLWSSPSKSQWNNWAATLRSSTGHVRQIGTPAHSFWTSKRYLSIAASKSLLVTPRIQMMVTWIMHKTDWCLWFVCRLPWDWFSPD